MYNKKKNILLILLFLFVFNQTNLLAKESNIKISNITPQAITTENTKYPDYAKMYLGDDKHEKFNRKRFLYFCSTR